MRSHRKNYCAVVIRGWALLAILMNSSSFRLLRGARPRLTTARYIFEMALEIQFSESRRWRHGTMLPMRITHDYPRRL